MSTDNDGVKLYPAWRQIEVDLFAQGLTYGSIITDEQIDQALGMKEPKTIADYERNQLIRLAQTQSLFDSLLENHRMKAARIKGVGWTILDPARQTGHAMHERVKEVKQAMGKLARELTHIASDRLTDEQRKENSDAIAKLGALRSMMRKRLK